MTFDEVILSKVHDQNCNGETGVFLDTAEIGEKVTIKYFQSTN